MKINKSLDYTLIELSKEDHAHLQAQVLEDSLFLSEHGLMDYSLLVVIEQISHKDHQKSKIKEEIAMDAGGFMSSYLQRDESNISKDSYHNGI